MFNVLIDGLAILDLYKWAILVFFITIFSFGFIALKHLAVEGFDTAIGLLSSFSLGCAVLTAISYVLILLAHLWPALLRMGSLAIFMGAILMLIREAWLKSLKMAFNIWLLIAVVALFLLLIARLAFLRHIILPPYSDSSIHYQIITELLNPGFTNHSKLSLSNIFVNYYHFGFHALAAWLASVTRLEAGNVIALLGQLFLIIAPLSVLFLTYTITKDMYGALFAGLLAAIGWLMPAFAVNWGKYPALAAVAVLPAVLAYLGLSLRDRNLKKPVALIFGLVLLTGIVLMHTRIILCVIVAGIAYFLSGKLQFKNELEMPQSIRLSILYILSLWPLSRVLLNFYVAYPVLIILIILLPFAFKTFPRVSLGVFFYMFGLWLIALAPGLVNQKLPALLDLQFLEIMLYIPFAMMGGAGFTGLLKTSPSAAIVRWSAVFLLVSGVVFNFVQRNSLYPSSCCDYFKEGDRLAVQWIQKNASKHSLFMIATFENHGKIVGTDAGIWIFPLTGQSTNKLPFNADWQTSTLLDQICGTGAKEIYLYMGGREFSFIDAQLTEVKWIKPVYQAGETVIYQVSGCSN